MPYLFSHFIGEGFLEEQVYFSLSKDGLHFKDLNNSRPILLSTVGERGVRDPFLIRDEHEARFFLIATDLRIEKGKGWKEARENGSKNIVVWQSTDLIDWSDPWMVEVAPPKGQNVWAPEVIYNDLNRQFLVYWSSLSEGKQKIYGAYTKNFRTFAPPFLFQEHEADIIDTTIVKGEDTYYYRLTKNEQTSAIFMDRSPDLVGEYEAVDSEFFRQISGVEGPQMYQLPDKSWALILDHFKEDAGYSLSIFEELQSGVVKPLDKSLYDFGQTKKRHGNISWISDSEYQKLLKSFR